jgi:hypothetical protein
MDTQSTSTTVRHNQPDLPPYGYEADERDFYGRAAVAVGNAERMRGEYALLLADAAVGDMPIAGRLDGYRLAVAEERYARGVYEAEVERSGIRGSAA